MDDSLRGMLRLFTGEDRRLIGYSGSRRYPRMDAVRDLVRRQAATGQPICIVAGTAPGTPGRDGRRRPRSAWGVDEHALDQAQACGLEVMVLEPDWRQHGRAAGPLRNAALVAQCDDLVAFWDGKSRGTADTILKSWMAGKLRGVYGPDGRKRAPDDAAARADAILSRPAPAAAAAAT